MLASTFISNANIRSTVFGSFVSSMPSLIFSKYRFIAFFFPSTSTLGNKMLHDLICHIKHPMYGTNQSQFKCNMYAHGKATIATYVLLIMYTPFYMLHINYLYVYWPRHVLTIFLHIRFNIAHICAPRCVMHLCHLYCCFLSREHLIDYHAL